MRIVKVSNVEIAKDQKVRNMCGVLLKGIKKAFKVMGSYIRRNVDNKYLKREMILVYTFYTYYIYQRKRV